MRQDDIISLLDAVGGGHYGVGNGWVQSACPFAPWAHTQGLDRRASFGVSISIEKESFCKCFACDFSGSLYTLLLNLMAKSQYDGSAGYDFPTAFKILNTKEIDSEEEKPELLKQPSFINKEVIPFRKDYLDSFLPGHQHPYLATRGIRNFVGEELGLLFDLNRYRLCAPIRDWGGQLVGLHGRDVTGKSSLPYLIYKDGEVSNLIVWYGESWVDLSKVVILTESIFDLFKIYGVYRNVACSLSASISKEKIARINGAESYITFYDHGPAGDRARQKLTRWLTGEIRHIIPTKEQDDAGNMTTETIKNELLKKIEELKNGNQFFKNG